MLPLQSLPWTDPLELASTLDESHWVLLYSGTRTSYSGRYSYLAFRLRESVCGKEFGVLAPKLGHTKPWAENAWFGYFGYGLKDSLESLTADQPGWANLPPLYLMRFGTILRFDHDTKTIEAWSDTPGALLPTTRPRTDTSLPPVTSIQSNMTQQAYLDKVARIITHIHDGDLYQANLTRKFSGHFASAPDAFALYRKLCAVSPAPYSAYMKLGEYSILSSSPELFLHIDANGNIRARPIKGTAPRHTDTDKDLQSRMALAASEKDRAENLMIVDLMRNDLSRSCTPGSVTTEGLFEVTSHATVHHMSSTILGQKRAACSTLDAIAACFPPGSMTGAPKIRAMNLCSELESVERGVYSGAIGWLGGDGSCELSVVIRTLILNDTKFEFQVGGAIVSDSTPQQELQETIDKSKGLLKALGISEGNIPY